MPFKDNIYKRPQRSNLPIAVAVKYVHLKGNTGCGTLQLIKYYNLIKEIKNRYTYTIFILVPIYVSDSRRIFDILLHM